MVRTSFNQQNNVNGVNGDLNTTMAGGLKFHTMAVPAVTASSEAYVKKVIDTLNDLDNVILRDRQREHCRVSRLAIRIDRFHQGLRGDQTEAASGDEHVVAQPAQLDAASPTQPDAVALGKMEVRVVERSPRP
ncbi:MAG: hypothetical protein R3C56_17780 [Pirellulaceae bacterium]